MDIDVHLLNQATGKGVPDHVLRIKIGSVCLIMRNLNIDNVLVNGTKILLLAEAKKMDGVVRILGYNFINQNLDASGYLVMELVKPLYVVTSNCQLLRTMVVGQARALDQVHALGYLHNDPKPDNFLFFAEGQKRKLCDFGLAYPITRLGSAAPNRRCAFTPGYIAPEAANGALTYG
ncbi:putative glycogen synthase kinase-3 homolog [Macrosteles quadrilineatus]|uniref:putative glycogen synthase kinase-3 homolog n=1 Tax=Macrosteles quadrilineatus TaxID=74068 RepID=UPI0023E26FAC|nr:putative glycogen synthase kinase-3 homolog [Macrosteles quadrilineatus]